MKNLLFAFFCGFFSAATLSDRIYISASLWEIVLKKRDLFMDNNHFRYFRIKAELALITSTFKPEKIIAP